MAIFIARLGTTPVAGHQLCANLVAMMFMLPLSQANACSTLVAQALHTSQPGIYAAGDVTTVPYKQIVIAMGEGSKAALSAFDHLIRMPVEETRDWEEAAE